MEKSGREKVLYEQKKYTNLEAFLSDLREIEKKYIATDAMHAMCETYFELNKAGGEFDLDPFSRGYGQAG